MDRPIQTFYSCACIDETERPPVHIPRLYAHLESAAEAYDARHNPDGEQKEETFDPKAPMSEYSLFPLDQLLFCEECQQIRCERCTLQEIVAHYCPHCLFETPATIIKSEGTRCGRGCLACPVCYCVLSLESINPNPSSSASSSSAIAPPFILCCHYCQWNTLEIGITFAKSTLITNQLLEKQSGPPISVKEALTRFKDESSSDKDRKSVRSQPLPSLNDPSARRNIRLTNDTKYADLMSFYKSQIAQDQAEKGHTLALGASTRGAGLNSPHAFDRIVNLYSSTGPGSPGFHLGSKRASKKAEPMRDAKDASEGLRSVNFEEEDLLIEQLEKLSAEERIINPIANQIDYLAARNPSSLLPTNILLATKRSSRCRICRHILVKPEPKLSSSRYRIRLLAQNYLPKICALPLTPASLNLPTPHLLTLPLHPTSPLPVLPFNIPTQHIITLTNPLYDPLSVSLAAPTSVPGPPGFKLTVLCPSFTIGANADLWDEALSDSNLAARNEKRRTKDEWREGQKSDVGDVWERGRNWVSVVFEVVVERDVPAAAVRRVGTDGGEGEEEPWERQIRREGKGRPRYRGIVEVPVLVRMGWKSEGGGEKGGLGLEGKLKEGVGGKRDREERRLEFWCSVPLGRVEYDD